MASLFWLYGEFVHINGCSCHLDWIVNKDIHAPFIYTYILSTYVLSLHRKSVRSH